MARAHYWAECFDCGERPKDDTKAAMDWARRHAARTDHTTACNVERDYIYQGGSDA